MKALNYNLLELQSEHFKQWDDFVDDSPQGDVFCYSWWLDAVTYGNFKIFAIFEAGSIVAGIPLAYYFGKINEPPLTRTLGPLFKPITNLSPHKISNLHRKWLNALIDKIPADEFEQFCTSHNFHDWLPFKWRGYKQMTRYTHLIDYAGKDEVKLWGALNRGIKKTIYRAINHKIKVLVTCDLESFYHIIELTYHRQNLEFSFSFKDFKRLDDEILKRDQRRIFTAFNEAGDPLAAFYFAFNSKSAYGLLGGGDPQFRKLGGQTLVLWEAIKYFRDKTLFFNFGGSDIPQIEAHLRGFGGLPTQYFRIFKDTPKNQIVEKIKEIQVIKEIEVIKKVQVFPSAPPDNWKYHVGRIMFHCWILIKKLLYKIHIRFSDREIQLINSQVHDIEEIKPLKEVEQFQFCEETNNPVFSIITPTCLRPKLLKRAIESVKAQTFTNYEHIIVDDANDAETAAVIAGFEDNRIKYFFHEKRIGAGGAYNTGLRHAKGKFINFLDDDDEYLSEILAKTYKIFLEGSSKLGFLWTGITKVKDTDIGEETLSTQIWPAKFPTKVSGILVSTGIGNGYGLSLKKSVADEIGFYDESLKVAVDTDFMIRLTKVYDFETIPEVMVKIHVHGNSQLTNKENNEERQNCSARIIARHFDFLSEHWELLYIHNNVHVNLCYLVKKKKDGRRALWKLFKTDPLRSIVWMDLLCYEFFGKDYRSSNKTDLAGYLRNKCSFIFSFLKILKNLFLKANNNDLQSKTVQEIKKLDIFRNQYDSISFKQLVKMANEWLHEYPEQASFDLPLIELWFDKFVNKPTYILEIGGWRGDLAESILSKNDFILCWDNFDLISDTSTQKCHNKRYQQIHLSNYIWDCKVDIKYNSLIATHVIEHLKWRELVLLIRWIPDNIKTVLFEAPIVQSAENFDWTGHYSTHILEKGWEQVINEMRFNNFVKVFSEKDTVIFTRE